MKRVIEKTVFRLWLVLVMLFLPLAIAGLFLFNTESRIGMMRGPFKRDTAKVYRFYWGAFVRGHV